MTISVENHDTYDKGELSLEPGTVLDVEEITRDRYFQHNERILKSQGAGATDRGLSIVNRYISEMVEVLFALKLKLVSLYR